jgi:hypothetical protein
MEGILSWDEAKGRHGRAAEGRFGGAEDDDDDQEDDGEVRRGGRKWWTVMIDGLVLMGWPTRRADGGRVFDVSDMGREVRRDWRRRLCLVFKGNDAMAVSVSSHGPRALLKSVAAPLGSAHLQASRRTASWQKPRIVEHWRERHGRAWPAATRMRKVQRAVGAEEGGQLGH